MYLTSAAVSFDEIGVKYKPDLCAAQQISRNLELFSIKIEIPSPIFNPFCLNK